MAGESKVFGQDWVWDIVNIAVAALGGWVPELAPLCLVGYQDFGTVGSSLYELDVCEVSFAPHGGRLPEAKVRVGVRRDASGRIARPSLGFISLKIHANGKTFSTYPTTFRAFSDREVRVYGIASVRELLTIAEGALNNHAPQLGPVCVVMYQDLGTMVKDEENRSKDVYEVSFASRGQRLPEAMVSIQVRRTFSGYRINPFVGFVDIHTENGVVSTHFQGHYESQFSETDMLSTVKFIVAV